VCDFSAEGPLYATPPIALIRRARADEMLALVVASNALVPQSLRAPQHSRLVGRRALVAMGPVMPDETWTDTPSGLKYLDSATGEGEPPAQGSVVTVGYTGWTMDGNQFDSGSISFAVGTGKVIRRMRRALGFGLGRPKLHSEPEPPPEPES